MIIGLMFFLQDAIQKNNIYWTAETGEQIRIKSLGIRNIVVGVGLIFALWIPRFLPETSKPSSAIPPVTVIPPAITVIAPNNSGVSISPSFSPIIEEFENSADFTATTPNIYVDRGQAHWKVSRSDGEQYIYRQIPPISSDVDIRLTVVGQIDDWTNNCHAGAGIGDSPGAGPAIIFSFYGGGCPQSGANIKTFGVNVHISEESCDFEGRWAWIERATPYRATLEIKGASATLLVEDVAKVFATKSYSGEYSVLWVGMTGYRDYPTCSGKFDSVTIEPNN
jgi:hypothetical protein